MSKITFEEYKSAIRAQYEVSKIEDVSGILLNPTPAQLRNLCLMKFENVLSTTDGNIFRLFFNVTETKNLRKAIENFDIGKFKPVISFLKGEKDTENTSRIELAAVLVDFDKRPYNRYILKGNGSERSDSGVAVLTETTELVTGNLDVKKGIVKGVNDNKPGRKVLIIVTVLLSLFFMGYTVKGVFFSKKECMKWVGNHYEKVSCTNDQLGIVHSNIIVPIDESVMKLEKLDSIGEHQFFRNEKPLIWYYKHDGIVEIFNAPGFHPETGKPLKPITNYIINKYDLK
ncbi:hypothetical protein [Flavobacterium sp. K5-23]|uniref:hypothetical protein n=1 Tax=Flavobacterium sp. K5-23 TaxID=2746225 RepID=UPI00200D0871|nr:hypothetical protein [Flavobacterium sp. K5-23]UQD57552.1 hypothetical protein FLAK523_14625 [Flavobacterium sp. K5-23]